MSDARMLAALIAKDLFTNGDGQVANRLVEEYPDRPIEGGGWSQGALANRIEKHLESSFWRVADADDRTFGYFSGPREAIQDFLSETGLYGRLVPIQFRAIDTQLVVDLQIAKASLLEAQSKLDAIRQGS